MLSLAASACGDPDGAGSASLVAVPPRAAPDGDPTLAGQSVAGFGFDLLAASTADKAPGANVIVSPLSVAIAFGMVEPGASGDTGPQLHELLRIADPTVWHRSMNALEQSLEARAPAPVDPATGPDQDPGELRINVANAAFMAPGYPFRADYLDAIGTNYGAALHELDFTDRAAAADRINEFIAGETDGHITDLVLADVIDPATVLALVNALLLQASWLTTFDAAQTADQPFTRIDGSQVTVPLMRGSGDRSGRGDGWVGASKTLVGNLRFEVVLPDPGRFDDVAARYAQVASELAASPNPGGELALPRFEARVNVPLTTVIPRMGLTAPFAGGGLVGIADDPELLIYEVLHETWLAVDESGVEAAAATVILMMAASAPVAGPIPVVLDRPFLFRIVDDVSGATLFTGRVMDPAA